MDKMIFDAPRYIDYVWLMHALDDYASPRAKVTTLLKKGDLIRIKKGLYIAGPAYRKNWSPGLLANRIYGPSYVSYEYALSKHGFIPERVENPASATLKKNCRFTTPVGVFSYIRIPSAVYHLGVDMAQEQDDHYLIATPEKAIADTVARNNDLGTIADIERYLIGSLRIDPDYLLGLGRNKMKAIVLAYARKSVTLLGDYLEAQKEKTHE
jgi:hypothetical protein